MSRNTHTHAVVMCVQAIKLQMVITFDSMASHHIPLAADTHTHAHTHTHTHKDASLHVWVFFPFVKFVDPVHALKFFSSG